MRSLSSVLFACGVLTATAQISHGGQPYGWGDPIPHAATIPTTVLSAMDREELIAAEDHGTPTGFKYGTQREVHVNVLAEGQWVDLPDDRRLCRYTITSPNAVMLSIQFDEFRLAPEAFVYLYNNRRTYFIGGFNSDNEEAEGRFATQVVPGDSITIEYVERVPSTGPSAVHISSITHGYRDIFHFGEQGFLRDFNPGFQSAPCHNNIICPIASNYQEHKNAVAMFLRPDGSGCTGALLNNTATPGTPYMHVALHCYTADYAQWVFYFNYESPTCIGDTGITNHTITGATQKAAYYFDDFVLFQLTSAPPVSWSPYYLGWDRSGSTPSSTAVIHHSMFDVKKFTRDNNASTSYTVLPYAGAPETVKCWKSFWDSGIVEPIASGSPLLDQNRRFVGHMYDGAQTCANANSVFTGCAKFSESWDGSSSTTRLRDWLDPANTSMTLNGYAPPAASGVRVRLVAMLEGPYDQGSGLMTGLLRTVDLVPTTEPYAGIGYSHVAGGGGETTNAGVLAVSGSAAVQDWVVVELRNKNNSSQVLATRSALILRNGSIVSPTDGTSDVFFNNMAADDYFIAVRHRNHLGIMTQNAQTLTATATLKNLTNGTVGINGGANAYNNISGVFCMYAGDVVRDNQLKYTGASNDRDPILTRVGGVVPTATLPGYYVEDTNQDGVVKYTGANNDRDRILVNIGGTVPTAVRNGQIP